jgi:hypothetical protein
MPNGLAAASTALGILAKLKDLFSSLAPIRLRFSARGDLDRLVEDFFAGDVLPGLGIRVRGVLSPYSCSVPAVAYKPFVVGSSTERAMKYRSDPGSGLLVAEIELSTSTIALSPPVVRFNDLLLADGTSARLGWLYPENFEGLIFDQQPISTSGEQAPRVTAAEVFRVERKQLPVLCLLPTDGSRDSFFGSVIEVVGRVAAADVKIATLLLGSLDQFSTNFLSRSIRPFEETSLCLAIDLRASSSGVQRISEIDRIAAVIGVQGLVEVTGAGPSEGEKIFTAATDAIPDRTGMGPLRGIGDVGTPGVVGIVSNGKIRRVFDNNSSAIAAYLEVNFADREQTVRSISELAHHWQAWQKRLGKIFVAAPDGSLQFDRYLFGIPLRVRCLIPTAFNFLPGLNINSSSVMPQSGKRSIGFAWVQGSNASTRPAGPSLSYPP